jgi:flavin-dependent dehydrogenase
MDDLSSWDVIIIGAGPAGALAGILLARQSCRTLIVDKASFPRAKACGGCLNRRTLEILANAGLGDVCDALHAPRIDRFRLLHGNWVAEIVLPPGRAVSRRTFDFELIRRAQNAGAHFMDGTRALVLPFDATGHQERKVLLSGNRETRQVSAKVVLVADGIGHPSLSQLAEFKVAIEPNSFIGLGTTIEEDSGNFPSHTIMMAVSRKGYVGSVVAERGNVNIAAAISPEVLKELGASTAVSSILTTAGVNIPTLRDAIWCGTRPLTCRSMMVASERLFVLGDAASYIEPFTGEGIAWALSAAVAVVPSAIKVCEKSNENCEEDWRRYHEWARRRQTVCRHASRLLRYPRFVRSAVTLLNWFPQLANPVVRSIS